MFTFPILESCCSLSSGRGSPVFNCKSSCGLSGNTIAKSDGVTHFTLKSFSLWQEKPSYWTELQSRLCGTYRLKVNNSIFPTVHAAEVAELDAILGSKQKRKEEIIEMLRNETKYERFHRMFTLNELGLLSPELKYIIKGIYGSFLVGLVFGAISSVPKTKEKFMRQNVATPFESEYLARRQLTDKMTLGAVKSGFQTGVKLSCATTLYLFVTLTAASVNNKVTVFEHIAGGALMGSLSRINYGLKGMAVGSGLGAVLGLCAGCCVLAFMKITGISFEEIRFWQHEYYAPEIQVKLKKKEE